MGLKKTPHNKTSSKEMFIVTSHNLKHLEFLLIFLTHFIFVLAELCKICSVQVVALFSVKP
jgi:hypothetical protein